MEEIFLTPNDIQDILQLSKNTAYRLINLKDFPKIKIGRNIRIPKSSFYEYMHNKQGLSIKIRD